MSSAAVGDRDGKQYPQFQRYPRQQRPPRRRRPCDHRGPVEHGRPDDRETRPPATRTLRAARDRVDHQGQLHVPGIARCGPAMAVRRLRYELPGGRVRLPARAHQHGRPAHPALDRGPGPSIGWAPIPVPRTRGPLFGNIFTLARTGTDRASAPMYYCTGAKYNMNPPRAASADARSARPTSIRSAARTLRARGRSLRAKAYPNSTRHFERLQWLEQRRHHCGGKRRVHDGARRAAPAAAVVAGTAGASPLSRHNLGVPTLPCRSSLTWRRPAVRRVTRPPSVRWRRESPRR